jgi:hypothetical protein
MPDTEELQLVVSLTDNASAQLSTMRTRIEGAFGSPAQAQLDEFTRKTDQGYLKIKELAEATTGVTKAFEFFTTGFGAAGIAITGLGYVIQAQLRNLQEFANHVQALSNAANSLGENVATVRNFQNAFRRVGDQASDGTQLLQDLQRLNTSMARLGGSPIEQMMLMDARSRQAEQNTRKFFQALRDNAGNSVKQAEIIRRASEHVYQTNLRFGEQTARAAQAQWLERLQITQKLMDLHSEIHEATTDEIQEQENIAKHVRDYNEQVSAISDSWDHIVAYFHDAAITSLITGVQNLSGVADAVEQGLKPGGKLRWFLGMGRDVLNYTPAAAARDFIDLLKFRQPGKIMPQGQTPARPQFFAGGAGGDELGDPRAEMNRQLKTLNDQLFELLHPPGAAGGAPGGALGFLGLGGGAFAPGGAAAPGGRQAGGTAGGGGATGTYDATPAPTAAQPGETGKGLIGDRERYAKELENNPALRDRILRIAYNEQGANPLGTQAVLESMMNRASVRGTSLAAQAHWVGEGRGGYYARGNMGRGALENAQTREILEQSLKNTLAGGNVARLGTDNSSGSLAAGERASGKFKFTQGIHGESFFSPGWGEPGLVPKFERWKAGLGNATESAAIDDDYRSRHNIQTNGKLTANVTAPKGTDVKLSGDGLFSKTELNRQTPLGHPHVDIGMPVIKQ